MFHVEPIQMETLFGCPVCGSSGIEPLMPVKDYFLSGQEFVMQRCNSCGFMFINPRPTQEEIGKYYQTSDYISHNADKSDLVSRVYRSARRFSVKHKFRMVASHIQGEKILDIGCGTGEFLAYCKKKKFEVYGIEPNEQARNFAIVHNQVQVGADIGYMEGLGVRFSCITMWHVLEHVHLLNETITKIKRMLSQHGVLIIAVPNCKSYDAGHYKQYWAAYDVPRHLSHFNTTSFTALMEKHGFGIDNIQPQYLDAFYISLLSEKYKNGRLNYFKAFFLGLWSNLMALKDKQGTSSLIYILTLKNT